MAHIIGNSPEPASPTGKRPGGENGKESTSVVVLQFMEIVRLRVRLHLANNPFRTVSVLAEERYCLGCAGVRWHDVWRGVRLTGETFARTRCRVCEQERL